MPTEAETREHVQRNLTDWLGSVQVDRDGDFVIKVESSMGYVSVAALTDTSTVVIIRGLIARGVKPSPEMFEWIATEGQVANWFGKPRAQKMDDGTYMVELASNLLGDSLDPDELRTAVSGVLGTANELDEEFVAKFGGERYID
jgi:hypothetical protein